jgi:hypothetical protein
VKGQSPPEEYALTVSGTTASQAAALLNAQAVHLDVLNVGDSIDRKS